MSTTCELLEQAIEIETNKFLELIAGLEGDQLYEFIYAVAAMNTLADNDGGTIKDIVYCAQNIKNIDTTLDSFYHSQRD